MTDDERKALELAANGKRITFHARHHWILTWIEEQPGKNLADKVWNVIDRAYRADYTQRGHAAMRRYWEASNTDHEYTAQDYAAMTAALNDACEYYGRAGLERERAKAQDQLQIVIHAMYHNVA